jgi:hypothetical protein
MNKILKSILFMSFFLSWSMAACSISVVAPTPVATDTPVPSETPTAAPTATPEASATPEFAPMCADLATPETPICRDLSATQSSTFCQDKDPYNLILFDQGLTYEVLTKGFRCSDAGLKGDKQMITCTGQFAANFAVNVCDPGCAVPTVQSTLVQCPQGYNYNARQGCCTNEIQEVSPNCKAFTFTTSTCVVNCFEYHREAKCKRHYDACIWDDKEKVCELRK